VIHIVMGRNHAEARQQQVPVVQLFETRDDIHYFKNTSTSHYRLRGLKIDPTNGIRCEPQECTGAVVIHRHLIKRICLKKRTLESLACGDESFEGPDMFILPVPDSYVWTILKDLPCLLASPTKTPWFQNCSST
jgi:hypothetical protein